MHPITMSSLSILLVEPSQAQAHVIERHLNELGVTTIREAKSGGAALREMQATLPHAVFSAMHLPDMTGVDLVRYMRSSETLKHVAFVLVSSETNTKYLEPVRQAGAVALLRKPFDLQQLQRALYTTLDVLTPLDVDLGAALDVSMLCALVVDDSRAARLHIRRVLGNMGITKVNEAENGKEAVARLEREFYDLIVTDYHMPEMDGAELVRFIREESAQQSVPILMVSSERDASRLAAIQQLGVSAICDKPFEPATVRELVERLFAK